LRAETRLALTPAVQNALIKGFSDVLPAFREAPRAYDETHFPTLEDQACADARLSRADEDRGRPQGALGPPREGSRAPFRLSQAIAAPNPRPPSARPRRAATRLTGPGAFEAVFERGQRREGRYVQLVYVPAAPAEAPAGRYGFVVGRRAMKRAVDRNRFKRVVRERLRALATDVAGYDLVIRVKRPVARDCVEAAAADAIALVERLCVPRSPA
jgi:ribonuclease P protein component